MYTGGYYSLRSELIRTGLHGHTGRQRRPVPDNVLDAVNAVQRTEWQINEFVLDVMTRCYDEGIQVTGLPERDDLPLPARLPDDVWEQMSVADRAKHKAEAALIHSTNAALQGQREETARRLRLAHELRGRSIWYPHSLDFRSRIYPLPQDLHPQGDDCSKGLLKFVNRAGEKLDDSGERWLAIGLANAYGHDKLPLSQRVLWTGDFYEEIFECVKDPFGPRGRFWMGAESPWTFLALAQAYSRGTNDVPVHIDATCSGVQHLSAMGLDPVGGRATNLYDTGNREDLYSEVARAVQEIVSAEALAGNQMAQAWVGNITRKTVKRAVMTTPYGVTSRGIRDQLMSDKLCQGLGVRAIDAADYMRDKIVEALETTVVSARQIMRWLQQVAHALASADLPFKWVTPSGVAVCQAYYKVSAHLIHDRSAQTLYGSIRYLQENDDLGLDTQKSASSAAPNFVHSFDAAHLHNTVNRCVGMGIRDFALIHDSFGTRPNDVALMADALRQEFNAIYQEDWLRKTYDYVKAYAPEVEIPEPPARGSLDISGVLGSTYFFS